MEIENDSVGFIFKTGYRIDNVVNESVDFCIKYNTIVTTTYNGVKLVITKFTDRDLLIKTWNK